MFSHHGFLWGSDNQQKKRSKLLFLALSGPEVSIFSYLTLGFVVLLCGMVLRRLSVPVVGYHLTKGEGGDSAQSYQTQGEGGGETMRRVVLSLREEGERLCA